MLKATHGLVSGHSDCRVTMSQNVLKLAARVLRVITCLLSLTLPACGGSYKEYYAAYEAPFDPQLDKINAVELFIHDIAGEWGLDVKEREREEMKFITSGMDAFQISLRRNGDMVILVSNAAIGTKLYLRLYHSRHMASEEVNRLAEEIKDGLERGFGLAFCPIDLRTLLCKG